MREADSAGDFAGLQRPLGGAAVTMLDTAVADRDLLLRQVFEFCMQAGLVGFHRLCRYRHRPSKAITRRPRIVVVRSHIQAPVS